MLRGLLLNRCGRLFIYLLLGAAVGAGLVAGTLLPDQTWMGGLYDAADEDALLMLVWNHAVRVIPTPLLTGESAWVALVAPPTELSASSPDVATADSRAPPLS